MQIRVLNCRELPGFGQYLLPDTRLALERNDTAVIALGAVLGTHSCGAVAARLEKSRAELTDLFVDAAARRRGIGESLLTELLERLESADIFRVIADYAAPAQDCEAIDALLLKKGFSAPQKRSLVFKSDSVNFHENRWIKAAFSPKYYTPASVTGFDMLPDNALERLGHENIVSALSPAELADRLDPSLSVAMTKNGAVCAYLLARESGENGCVLLSAVSLRTAPVNAVHVLLKELVNRCYYRLGGDFSLYFSTLSPRAEALALRLTDGAAEIYEEHVCYRINP